MIPSQIGTFKSIKERCDNAFKKDALWRNTLEDVYEYCLPNRNLFNEESPGQKKMDKIFDSTAIEGIQSGASKLQDNIAPIWKEWAKLEPSAEIERMEGFKALEDKIRERLDKHTEIIFDYINRSNFHTQFYECALDVLIGTGTLAIDETGKKDNPIVFSTIPQKGIAFEESVNGSVGTHFRKHKIKARNITLTYKGFKPSSAVADIIRKDPESDVNIVQGIIEHFETGTYHGVAWVDGEDMASWYEDYKESNPWSTSRYSKVAGEIRGRGPAIQVLPDIKTLNKIKEFSLQKAAIDLIGIWTATDDGVTNPYNLTLTPGLTMPVGSNNTQNPSLMRLDTSTPLNLVMFEVEDLTNKIKRAFFSDLRDPDSPVRSATEIAIEAREQAKRLGSAFGRLQTELLIPILNRVAWILARNGILEPVKIGGREISVKFTSPLATAQDMEEVLSTQQAIEFTLNTAGPEMVKVCFETQNIGTWGAKKIGVPQELISSEANKQIKLEAGARMAQQMVEKENGVGRAQPEPE